MLSGQVFHRHLQIWVGEVLGCWSKDVVNQLIAVVFKR